jgi:hypothetical protein
MGILIGGREGEAAILKVGYGVASRWKFPRLYARNGGEVHQGGGGSI